MAQLGFEIQELLNHVKLLKQKEPTNQELIDQYDKLSELLEETQGQEWDENHQGYRDAKSALETANAEAKAQVEHLSNLAATIEKLTAAVTMVVSAVA